METPKITPKGRGSGVWGSSAARCRAQISPGTAEDKEVGRDKGTVPERC